MKYQFLVGSLTIFIFSFLGTPLCWSGAIKNPSPVLRSGDLFPKISLPSLLSQKEKKYLGLGEKKTFSLEEIKSDLIVIKYLNTNCPYCIKLLPIFNEIHQIIEQDSTLNGKVNILGISAGDTPIEVAEFKKKHSIPYPIVPDPEFIAHKTVGGPRVPLVVVARRDIQGKWVVATVNVVLIFSTENFIGELKTILTIDPETFRLKKP